MEGDPKLSALSTAILCQLLVEPRSGYSLKRIFQDTPMGHFSTSPGAIYPALQRMEKAGWIQGTRDNPGSLRARRVYRLSTEGTEVLKRFCLKPVTREDIIHNMGQLLLGFAFMTPLAGRPATLSFLKSLSHHLEGHVHDLKEEAGRNAGKTPEGNLALDHGIRIYEASLEWSRQALQELGEHP